MQHVLMTVSYLLSSTANELQLSMEMVLRSLGRARRSVRTRARARVRVYVYVCTCAGGKGTGCVALGVTRAHCADRIMCSGLILRPASRCERLPLPQHSQHAPSPSPRAASRSTRFGREQRARLRSALAQFLTRVLGHERVGLRGHGRLRILLLGRVLKALQRLIRPGGGEGERERERETETETPGVSTGDCESRGGG